MDGAAQPSPPSGAGTATKNASSSMEASFSSISPFGREREYALKPAEGAKAVDRRRGPAKPAKVESKLVTASYRHLVAPFFQRHEPSRASFVAHTVPYLVRNTSPATTAILSGVWFKKHGRGSYGAFMREVMRAIQTTPRPSNGVQSKLRTQRQREAMAVAVMLAGLHEDGVFPLPSRELQLRLLLPDPMAGWRIMAQLVRLGALEMVDPGLSRPEASKRGEVARSATFRLPEPRS